MDLKLQLKNKLDQQSLMVKSAVDAGRAMTEDEQKQFDTIETEIKNLEKTIEAQEKVAKAQAAAQQPAPGSKILVPAQPINHDDKKWRNMGEYLQAVRNAYVPNGSIDNRLTIQNAATGLSGGISSEGGFLLDNQFIEGLQQAMTAESQLAKLIKTIPIGDNTNRLKALGVDENSRANGSRWGGVQAFWAAEADTVAASKPKFRDIDMKLEKLLAFCYVTDELMQDATALEAIIKQAYAEEMAFKVDDAILNGDGVGKPMGILGSGALVTQNKESGQTTGTIVHGNITKMWQRLVARSRSNAVWLINQECEGQLTDMSFTSGGNTMMSPYAKEYVEKGTIKNRPVITLEQAAGLGTAGDIVLADPSQYLGIDKTKAQADVSIHVRFLYDEQVFRFVYRFNGQTYRTAPITPYKGTNTLSNFIALQAR
ncbi:phage major capsid protein [Neobacillus drentensis]|uniref:phage major capsid protein n=1 Tax=Neobacillus drentensis TaxID=220684 RepID=UPI0030009AA0